MPPKASSSKAKAKTTTAKAATRSQSKSKSPVEELQTDSDSDTCVCEIPTTTMDANQKEEFKEFFRSFLTKMKGDFEKESEMQRTRVDSLHNKLEKKSTSHSLKPEDFDGNPVGDASAWLDNFSRIAKLNNWSSDLQLNAFPLYLKGIAHAWFLSLPATVSGDINQLFDAFRERFASGPQDWILSQQLSARKHHKGELLDHFIADITRLCKRLKLSDNDTMRYFIEGLQGDLQAYVSLGRPKTFQEAESLARMKDIVNKCQGLPDAHSVLENMQTMFTKLMEQPANNDKVIAAAAPSSVPSESDMKIKELSEQIKQLQKQQQQQHLQAHQAMAAYD